MQTYDSLRSVCGKARVQYDPGWSTDKPYSIFYNGTATVCESTLDKAIEYCKQKYKVLFDQEKIEHARRT